MELPQQLNNLIDNITLFENIDEEQISFSLEINTNPIHNKSNEDFVGKDDDSTEISSLVSGLETSDSMNNDSESVSELLNILKSSESVKSVEKRVSFNTLQPRRVLSLSGKVLTKNFDFGKKLTPERMSNPVFKNYTREM